MPRKQQRCADCTLPCYGEHCMKCAIVRGKRAPNAGVKPFNVWVDLNQKRQPSTRSWWVGLDPAQFAPVAAQEFDTRLRFVPGSTVINIID
jgi:hypothetical protein